MQRPSLILTLLLISALATAQVSLDSAQYFMVVKYAELEHSIYLCTRGAGNDTVYPKNTVPGRYTLAAAKEFYRFSVAANGLVNDTLTYIRSTQPLIDSCVMLIRHSKILQQQFYSNGKVAHDLLFRPNSQISRTFSKGKLTYTHELQLINGQAASINTAFYPNGNKYAVSDRVRNCDSFFHDNGKIKEVKNLITEDVKLFNQDGSLISHTYRKELKDQIPSYSIYEDELERGQLLSRRIRTYENQVTILRYRKGKVHEKEVVTQRDNGYEEIVEIYNARGKKIKEFNRDRGRQEIKVAKPTLDHR